MTKMPKFVQSKEVGHRDGLQNEKEFIPTPDKVEWINMLFGTVCGFKIVEFHHSGNPGPNIGDEEPESDEEFEFFRFEKVMK